MELRPYQIEAIKAVHNEWEKEGHAKTLISQATGTGKTVEFSQITADQISNNERVLQLMHREELLTQSKNKLYSLTGLEAVIEKAESTSIGSNCPVVIGSVQTMMRESRLNKFTPDYFKTIIVDEAHHSISESYQKVLSHFPDAKVLGVTATPDRGDKRNLGEYYNSIAYDYPMSKAIKDGYLVPIKAKMIPLDINLDNVKITSGDYNAGDLGDALEPYLESIADNMVINCKGRKTVVFLPLIATSKKFCVMLERRGIRAVEVNGNTEDRNQILNDFENGKYDVICNSMLLTEGWDCPSVDCVCVLRPTKVRGLYQQMIGRGTRLAPNKKDLLILDFLWLSTKYDLCRPSSLVSKDKLIEQKIDDMVKNEDGEIDIIEAEETATRDIVAEREKALAKELEESRKRKARLIDPIQYCFSIADEDLIDYVPTFAWELAPASEKQLKFLEGKGINPDLVENKGMACMIIDRMVKRIDEGLASPKQIRTLERFGFRNVGAWDFKDAQSKISLLAANHWRVPGWLDPTKFIPERSAL